MPEWESLLREKLGRLRVPPARADEIVAEIADHLDEAWGEQARAVNGTTASSFLSAQIGSGARLRAGIERAENPGGSMKRLWYLYVPLVLGILSALVGPNGTGVLPVERWFTAGGSPGVYLGRAISYFLIAGLAAFVARHTGATHRAAFASGMLTLWRVGLSVLLTFYFFVVHPLPKSGVYFMTPRSGFSMTSVPAPANVFWLVLLDAMVTAVCYAAGALVFSRLRVGKQPEQSGMIHA